MMTSSWAQGGGGWSGSRNPTLSFDDDEDESVSARGCKGMGAESGREALYNALEGGSQEGERGCREEGHEPRGHARERAPAIVILEASHDLGDALHLSRVTYVKI